MKLAEKPDWVGRTVVCLASGPSLTREDIEAVRAAGHPVIVANTTFRDAPWADILFGMDLKWWREYGAEAKKVFQGRRLSTSHAAKSYGAESLYQCKWFPDRSALNTGQGLIVLAMAAGAPKVVLLGFDVQLGPKGEVHHHGDHPRPLGNAGAMKRWPKHFAWVADEAKRRGCEVINASRATALHCFPRAALEASL